MSDHAVATVSRPATSGRAAVRFMSRSVRRSRIWLAMLELAATSAVPASTTRSRAGSTGRPAVSQAAAATVAASGS